MSSVISQQKTLMQMEDQIAEELIRLAEYDLQVREKLLKENKLSNGYNPEMEAVHIANASRLKKIIELIGWPTQSKVGEDASNAAWLIVQHSIGDAVFMRKTYAMMMMVRNDINRQNIAYLYDRICYFEGRPQRYGTQYDDDVLYPVENKNELNALREKMNLQPVADEIIVECNNAEEDLHKDEVFNEWRKRQVGFSDEIE